MLLYDPRFDRKIKTNNPAIVLADRVIKSNLVDPDKEFWDNIRKLANYMDFDVKPKKKNMV
jgi:hypothetical protein